MLSRRLSTALHRPASGAALVERGDWRRHGLLLVVLTRLLHARYDWARVLHSGVQRCPRPALRDGDSPPRGSLGDRRRVPCSAARCSLHLKALLPGAAGLTVAIFGSAAIFALLHIGPGTRFLPWTLSAFVVGLLLAVVFVTLGDLIAPIAIQKTVNLLNLKDIVRRPVPVNEAG